MEIRKRKIGGGKMKNDLKIYAQSDINRILALGILMDHDALTRDELEMLTNIMNDHYQLKMRERFWKNR